MSVDTSSAKEFHSEAGFFDKNRIDGLLLVGGCIEAGTTETKIKRLDKAVVPVALVHAPQQHPNISNGKSVRIK